MFASWDDGAAADVRIAELMAKFRVPAVFYWPYNLEKSLNVTRIGRFLTRQQCRELAKHFEVGSHTVSHPHLTKIPIEEARREIVDSRRKWQDFTGQEVNSFCYPRGYADEAIRSLVRDAGYSEARNVAVGVLDPPEDPYWTGNTVHVGIDRAEYARLTPPAKGRRFLKWLGLAGRRPSDRVRWQDFAILMLQEARRREAAVYRIFGHSWEIERDNSWSDLEWLLKELTS